MGLVMGRKEEQNVQAAYYHHKYAPRTLDNFGRTPSQYRLDVYLHQKYSTIRPLCGQFDGIEKESLDQALNEGRIGNILEQS